MSDRKRYSQGGTDTLVRSKVKTRHPPAFRVLMLNDDFTSMDFVVAVLESIFRKTPAEAVQIMLHVHNNGQGLCGIFSREIAELKVDQVHKRAAAEGFPLRCVMEEV